MKMPSTYISLLLFCGLVLLFYYNKSTYNVAHIVNRSMVKETRPVVKRVLPGGSMTVPLNKYRSDGNTQPKNCLGKNNFSFFKEVLPHLMPALKLYK
jgi:hypothetical protein